MQIGGKFPFIWLFIVVIYKYKECDKMITKKRIEQLRDLSEEEILKITYKSFAINEINTLISETPMTDQEKRIALMRFNKEMTFQEIADKECLDVKTVKKKCTLISSKIRTTLIYIVFFGQEEYN